MPQQSKTRWAQLRVGLMTLVALAILGYLIFLLTGTQGLFKTKSDLYTYLGDSAALIDGAPVRLNGIAIGRVRHVGLSGSSEPHRVVKVDMEVESAYLPSIPVDSQAQLSAENLLGTKYVNIKKGSSAATVRPDGELPSLDTTEIEDVVQQGATTLAALQSILERFEGIIGSVEVGKGTIGKLLVDETLYNNFLAISRESTKLVASLNATVSSDQNTIGRLLHDNNEMYNNVRDSVARINHLADDIDHGPGLVGKLVQDPALYDDARKTIADVRQTLADINAGKGTLGKWIEKDDLHDQVQATLGRLDGILDKLNSGQGTVGQLLVNPSLAEDIDGTTRELQGLLQDFRKNPKKFLRIKISVF